MNVSVCQYVGQSVSWLDDRLTTCPRNVRQSLVTSTLPPVRYSKNNHNNSTIVTASRRCW